MNWYYAEAGQQVGPITEAELEAHLASGKITPETLVWRQGMAEWQPLSVARSVSGSPSPVAVPTVINAASSGGGVVVCSVCGTANPPENTIQYGDANVCANCKPAFMQRIKEGGTVAGQANYAGFWMRFLAKVIDGIGLWVVQLLLTFVVGKIAPPADELKTAIQQLILVGVAVVINMAYNIFFVGKYGATPGKMALKLKVVPADGGPMTFGRATGRAFAEILSGIICYIGYLMAAFDTEKRSLHDRLAGTRVIKR